MISREEAVKLVEERVQNKNIVKHMFALEALMGEVYEELKKRGKAVGWTKEEWRMAGFLHDGDYCESVPLEKQGIEITRWAREKGYGIPENVAYAMAAHNFRNTQVAPESLMDWAIVAGDTLTGLIVACALVRPDRKLAGLTADSVLKKFPSKSFAAGTRREDIALCEEKLGISLKEFVGIALSAMQGIAGDLGL